LTTADSIISECFHQGMCRKRLSLTVHQAITAEAVEARLAERPNRRLRLSRSYLANEITRASQDLDAFVFKVPFVLRAEAILCGIS